jgi:hypothetical protein
VTDRDGVEIEQHMPFQQREWAFQRTGWCLLSAFVLLAALGLFGDGPLSHVEGIDAGTRVTFERFVRVWSPARMTLDRGLDESLSKDTIPLRVSRPFFDAIRIDRLTPEPMTISIGTDEVELQFAPPDAPATRFSVVLDFQAQRGGRQTAVFTWADGAAVRVTQFVYF